MIDDPRAEELLVAVVPGFAEDFLMALRYHYYVKARSLVPDPLYDAAEKDYMARADTDEFTTPLNLVGSSNPSDYPDHIKALALYLGICDHKKLKSIKP